MKEKIEKLIKNWRQGYSRGVSVTDVLKKMRRTDACIYDWNNKVLRLIELWEKLDFANIQKITEEFGWEEGLKLPCKKCDRGMEPCKRLKNPQAQALCEYLINIFKV